MPDLHLHKRGQAGVLVKKQKRVQPNLDLIGRDGQFRDFYHQMLSGLLRVIHGRRPLKNGPSGAEITSKCYANIERWDSWPQHLQREGDLVQGIFATPNAPKGLDAFLVRNEFQSTACPCGSPRTIRFFVKVHPLRLPILVPSA